MNPQTLKSSSLLWLMPPMPIMLYNMPETQGKYSFFPVNRPFRSPEYCGIKDSSGNIVQISEVIAKTRNKNFSVFAGREAFSSYSNAWRCWGNPRVANVVPNIALPFTMPGTKGRLIRPELQLGLLELNAAVTARFGIGGMKSAMEMAGYWEEIHVCQFFPPQKKENEIGGYMTKH